MRAESTRSTQTISRLTQVVDCFFDAKTNNSFFVRRMTCRKNENRQLFIIVLEHDNKSDKFYTVPFAEVSVIGNRIRFIVDPKLQYPELYRKSDKVIELIKSSILSFMSKYKQLSAH